MKWQSPEYDVLWSAVGLKMLLGLIPVLFVICLVRGDAPLGIYAVLVVSFVALAVFTFALLPQWQAKVKSRRGD